MRQSRQLTESERWELGLFLSMLVVGCLCVTAILQAGGLPRMWAAAEKPEVGSQKLEVGIPKTEVAVPVTEVVEPVAPVVTVLPDPSVVKKAPAADIKVYQGEKYKYVRTLRLRVTAYAPDGRCCWPYPGTTTATGLSVKTNHGHLVAADPRVIPMHSLVVVPGYQGGNAVPVLDQGGEIKGHRLDVMLPSFEAAKEWGSRLVDVKVYEASEGR